MATTTYCASCGKPLPEGAMFCPACDSKREIAPTLDLRDVADSETENPIGGEPLSSEASALDAKDRNQGKVVLSIVGIIAIVLVIVWGFSSLKSSPVVGSWYDSPYGHERFTFKSDGSGLYQGSDTPFKWKASDGSGHSVIITYSNGHQNEADVSSDGLTLIVNNQGSVMTYYKNKADAKAADSRSSRYTR